MCETAHDEGNPPHHGKKCEAKAFSATNRPPGMVAMMPTPKPKFLSGEQMMRLAADTMGEDPQAKAQRELEKKIAKVEENQSRERAAKVRKDYEAAKRKQEYEDIMRVGREDKKDTEDPAKAKSTQIHQGNELPPSAQSRDSRALVWSNAQNDTKGVMGCPPDHVPANQATWVVSAGKYRCAYCWSINHKANNCMMNPLYPGIQYSRWYRPTLWTQLKERNLPDDCQLEPRFWNNPSGIIQEPARQSSSSSRKATTQKKRGR